MSFKPVFYYLQCKRMDWVEDFEEVGIEEMHRLDSVIPSPKDVDATIAGAEIPGTMTQEEESALLPTFTMFGTPQ